MPRPTRDEVSVFARADDFRAWLDAHHDSADQIWVGYFRKGTGKTAMTYPQAVEEALCFGWIDGLTYRIDDEVHANRFTPRRKGSSWSGPNIAKVAELKKAGRMHPAGVRAFEERDRRKDQPSLRDNPLRQALPPELARRMKAQPAAWTYWQAETPSYRRQAAFWIQSAVRPETRDRRLARLIEDSAAGRRVNPLSYGGDRR